MIYVCVYICVYICDVYVYICICIGKCMYAYVYMCMYVICECMYMCVFKKQFFPQIEAHLSGFCSISISKAFSISKVRQALN